eukprot:15473795-Alexandrium_andersonii.AAC.1
MDKAPQGQAQHGLRWPGRAVVLARRLRELDVQVCGLQESRTTGPDLVETGGLYRLITGPLRGSLGCE